MTTRPLGLRRGDTLIEVTIALAILSLIISLSTVSAIRVYRTAILARERSVAYNLAQRQADALRAYARSLSWNNFVGITGSSDCNSLPHICAIISGANSYVDANGNTAGGALNPVSISSPGILDPQINQSPHVSHMFYLHVVTQNTIYGTLRFWDIDPAHSVDLAGQIQDNKYKYHVTVIPNRVYIPGITQPQGTPPSPSDNVLRFDIKVEWISQIGDPNAPGGAHNQEASLVVFLSRSEGS